MFPANPRKAVREMKYAFKFVCQEGKLEAQAILLVASLKRFLRCDYELVAAVTFNNRKPSDVVLEFLKKLGVRIVDIKNNTGNPYNNPIFCLGVPTDAQKNVLMDTDLLASSPTNFFSVRGESNPK